MLQKWRKQVDHSLHLLAYGFHVFGPHKKELKGRIFRLGKDIRAVGQCFEQQQPRESLCREYIDWCISGMLASPHMGTILAASVSTPKSIPGQDSPLQASYYEECCLLDCNVMQFNRSTQCFRGTSCFLLQDQRVSQIRNQQEAEPQVQQLSYYFMICNKLTLSVAKFML